MGEAVRPLAELSEKDRDLAWSRWLVIAPAVEDHVPLTRAAADAGVPISTARRWLAHYRGGGLGALARRSRSDHGRRRTQPELVGQIEALALRRPQLTAASIARRVQQTAREQGWAAPAYSTVAGIIATIDPALMTLAQDGAAALRDRYELVYRREADRPNEIWQADHTELDVLILDTDGSPARPWLTLILDDHSRAVAGFTVFLGAPSALSLSLALRQAIWRKADAAWPVHGLPDALHVDHGSDFTSRHIEQVCADLHVRRLHSAIARPQGPGKSRETVWHDHHRASAQSSRPSSSWVARHTARAHHRRARSGDPRLGARYLSPPRASRDARQPARALVRRGMAAADARDP